MAVNFPSAIASFEPRLPLGVAYSGGADSTALLVACARRWPGRVVALHINHGLQAAATQFESHCEAACKALGVPLHVERTDARHEPGESPEDAARRARYDALHRVASRHKIATVALAQHADDQVETLLLALSRGAGIAGLAGMRAQWHREGVDYCRPLLSVSAAEIREWLRAEGVAWIEDPTNASEQYTRNRIRSRVVPALDDAFVSYRDTFARSARHAAHAQAVLDEVAAGDLERIGSPPPIGALQTLSRPRQANVLRHWLKALHAQQASTAQLDELLDQVASCTTRGHQIRIKVGDGFVERGAAGLVFTPSV